MILSDKDNLYMPHGEIRKMRKVLGLDEIGVYLTIKSFEYDFPDGIDENQIFKSALNDTKSIKKAFNGLISKGFVKKTNKGYKTTTKRYD